jgi:hypothetical protein
MDLKKKENNFGLLNEKSSIKAASSDHFDLYYLFPNCFSRKFL